MTGAELICNAIVGQNLQTKQKIPSANSVPATIVDEFGNNLPVYYFILYSIQFKI